jgi:SAM-dependent methyltransferase
VHSGELQDCRFEPRTFDGVFVWNCFEQIEDPEPLLTECSRILKHEGLLVLRTPNEVFYSICRQLLLDSALAAPERRFVIDALGYNNLLGFPYLYGYGAERLEHCVQPFGFERQGMLNSELLTLPLPEDPDWVKLEERTVNEQVKFIAQWTLVRNGALAGPWIECWFRLRKSQNIA